jgi:O-succinylbenzoic acid--CoA ligase
MNSYEMMDFESDANRLLINPRLPRETSLRFQNAWQELVASRFKGQIGIPTSGSSGDSFGKIIVLSKAAVLASAQAVNRRLQASSSDVWLMPLPEFHVGGLGIRARAHLSRSSVHLIQSPKWSPEAFAGDVQSFGVTLTSLVPTQVFDIVGSQLLAPPGLRAIFVGGGRLDPMVYQRAVDLGWPLLPSYGLTECASQVATAVEPGRPELMPLSHIELAIDKQEKIIIRSSALLTGRISFDAEGRASFADPKQGGWLTTDDRGRLLSDGSLLVLGRDQDFVKIGGEGVLVSRLESRLEELRFKLYQSEGSSGFRGDLAILAAADARLGATIVLLTESTVDEIASLIETFNTLVAPFERIRRAYSVAKIPRSPLGKLLRREALALVGLEPASNL